MKDTELAKVVKNKDHFSNTADKVLKDFQKAGAVSDSEFQMDREPEKKKVTIKAIDPKNIELNENIRKVLDQESEEFKKLVTSIRQHGILQSILVEERSDSSGQIKYICVEGHRRVIAALQVGINLVPSLVKKYSSNSMRFEEALAADTKEFLNPLDRAEAYRILHDHGKEIDEIARIHDRDPLTVQRYIKMARWSEEAKNLIRTNSKIFTAKYLLHNYVQRSIDGEELIQAITNKINLQKNEEPKKTKKRNSIGIDETSIDSKLFSLFLQKQGVQVNMRQTSDEVVATLHLSPSTLTNIVKILQKIDNQ